MRKLSTSLLILLLSLLSLDAQVIIDLENYNRNRNVGLMLSLHDAVTDDPVVSATVYLIPRNDTVITHFALSDGKGEVTIPDIVPGWYQVNVEMIGYRAYRKEHHLKESRNDLGLIRLEENIESIDAATVTAIGNAVSVQGDTLIYNASSFSVGEDAVLEDLLRKMPGIEVAKDGTVRANGEPVDKITIGGKTFFFNDPAMALKNLPAKVVDRIRIIDRGNDESEFSGVGTKDDRETVMDLELKERYRKGWFGNSRLSLGNAAHGDSPDAMRSDAKPLFNANAVAAWYDEMNQVTFIANGKNAAEPGSGTMVYYSGTDDIDPFVDREGLTASAQAGVNWNTGKIGGMETSANVAYNHSRKDAREMSARTSFQPDGGTVRKDGEYRGDGSDDRVSASFYIKNDDTRKYLVSISPVFYYSKKGREESAGSLSVREGTVLNGSRSSSVSGTDVINTRTDWTLGVRDLGRARRSVTFGGSLTYRNKDGFGTESNEIKTHSGADLAILDFDRNTDYLATEGVLSYVEPIGDKWAVQARLTACYIAQTDAKSAFNAADGSANDGYSAISGNKDMLLRERILVQYERDRAKAVLGLQVDREKNEIHSMAGGTENGTGNAAWAVNLAPYADIEWSKNSSTFSMSAGGSPDTPMDAVIMSALDIVDPAQVVTGNIYLKTGFSRNVSAGFMHSNPKTFSYYGIHVWGNLMQNGVVYASWFDDDGVRYTIPVNSESPGYDFMSYMDLRKPVSRDRKLTMTCRPMIRYAGNLSYQARTRLPGLDRNGFDYGRTMSWFWGDAGGNRFYSGSSGFSESMTTSLDCSIDMRLEYRTAGCSIAAGAYAENMVGRYSLDRTADSDVWNCRVFGEFLWSAGKGWEVRSDLSMNLYMGYQEGYDKPECLWNMQLSKAIRSITLRLSAADILDQEKSLHRTASAEYMQDSYHIVMGRYFLAGVSFSFGKMNARNNSKVQSAMMQTAY